MTGQVTTPTRDRLIGVDEAALLVALALLAIGGWMAWRPSAFLLPGGCLLWLALPTRTPWIVRDEPRGPAATHQAIQPRRRP